MAPVVYWCELALVDERIVERVAVSVEDGRFGSIQPGVEPPVGSIRLAGLSIPGLANCHSHAFHRALRSRTQQGTGSFWTWRELMYRAAERLDPESYHRLARACFAEMALAGIAVVGEFHYLHHQPDGTPYADPNAMGEALLAAADEAGVRITLLDTLYLHGGQTEDGYQAVQGTQHRFSDGTVDRWAARVERLVPSERQRIGAAIHSVRAVDPESMRSVRDWAEAHQAPLHAHVSEQPAENAACLAHHGTTPTGLLQDAGVLNERFSAIHATHLTDEDVGSYARTSACVCFCPTTERDLGDGIGPASRLAQAGVGLTLGTDSHAMIDMFEEARALELNDRLAAGKRGLHRAIALLEMATSRGHRSLGWNRAGRILEGNRADLVTISLNTVRTAGATLESAIEASVFAATTSDITHVLIDGKTVAADGRHTSLDTASELESAIRQLLES